MYILRVSKNWKGVKQCRDYLLPLISPSNESSPNLHEMIKRTLKTINNCAASQVWKPSVSYPNYQFSFIDNDDTVSSWQQFVTINFSLTLSSLLPDRLSGSLTFMAVHRWCCIFPGVDLVNPLLSEHSNWCRSGCAAAFQCKQTGLRNAACLPTGCCDLVFLKPTCAGMEKAPRERQMHFYFRRCFIASITNFFLFWTLRVSSM